MQSAIRVAVLSVLAVTVLGAPAARADVNVSGRWRLVTSSFGTADLDFVQSGAVLNAGGRVGTIDPTTGVFDISSSGPDCQYSRYQGTATDDSMSGTFVTGFRELGPFGGCNVIDGAFTATRNPFCGNGIPEADEACDDGNLEWDDCCNPLCVQMPAGWPCADDGLACTKDRCNAAGVCQHSLHAAGEVCRASTGACDVVEHCDGASPVCPADVSPDADGDGRPDACDTCPSGRALVAAKLKAGTFDGTSGNDTLTVSGRTTLDAGVVLDPITHGLVIDVEGDTGGAFTASVPAGAEDPVTRQGWKVSRSGTSWSFRGTDPALLVTKAQVKRSGSVVTVKASGRRTSFATAMPQAPVRLTVALDAAPASACGEATFNAVGGPAPRCTARGTSLVCK